RPIELRLILDSLGDAPFGALVEHGDNCADDLQMAELLGGDVDQHVLAARIILREILRKISKRSRELSLRAPELLQHQVGKTRIALTDTYGVLQTLVVTEHDVCPRKLFDHCISSAAFRSASASKSPAPPAEPAGIR